jgi:hypothetical protein
MKLSLRRDACFSVKDAGIRIDRGQLLLFSFSRNRHIPWNLHEPAVGQFYFTENTDLM